MSYLIDLADFLVKAIGASGYLGIFFLMFLESSIVPLPGEFVIPPAGYLAAVGKMNLWVVIIDATLGSLAGALFNYYVSKTLGLKIVLKFSKIFRLEKALKKTVVFFEKHGAISVFVGRLLPTIRHLISIPAGLSKMRVFAFSLFTTLGAFIYTAGLALIGYFVGKNPDLLKYYMHRFSAGLIAFAVILIIGYIFYRRKYDK
ncbi:MAG: DedA family protein [Desulfurella sp.]|uniref:DedA family protein n=1 Tax=Desulfurella sp. TaxID=1962857 RepID=UPI003D12BA20